MTRTKVTGFRQWMERSRSEAIRPQCFHCGEEAAMLSCSVSGDPAEGGCRVCVGCDAECAKPWHCPGMWVS